MHIIAKILPFSYLSVSGFRFFMLLCYMAFKITLLREEFSANITLKTFLSCVDYKMVLQFSGVFENTKAEFTNKSFAWLLQLQLNRNLVPVNRKNQKFRPYF